MHYTNFTVKQGRQKLAFPIDMLRYDSCYPRSQHDVTTIVRTTVPRVSSQEPAQVTLTTRHSKGQCPHRRGPVEELRVGGHQG